MNINYFLANRSNVILDDTYPGGNGVTIDWLVTRDSDGSTVASGSTRQEFIIYNGLEAGAMLYLNKTGSGYEKWQPGAYTATVSFNKDGKFREAYYINNYDKILHFTVIEKAAPDNAEPDNTDVEPQDDGSSQQESEPEGSGSTQKKSEPEKENVENTANTSEDPVRTGDESNLALWMLIAVLAAVEFAFMMILKTRRRTRK